MQYVVPVSERIPWLQFVPSGEQNHPLAMQLMPLVTLCPLLAHVQHTVSPSIMSNLLGTNARPCPTVTSHTRGPGGPQGVRRGRGVGVGLAVTGGESTNAKPVMPAVITINRSTRGTRGNTNALIRFVVTGCNDRPSDIFIAKLRPVSSMALTRPSGFFLEKAGAHRTRHRRILCEI